jgi:hypothetical protein
MLLVAAQQRPALRQPGQRPLHHPAAGLAAPGAALGPPVRTDRPDVVDVPVRVDHLMPGGRIVPLVQAQVLLDLFGVGPLDHDRLDGRLQELRVVDVGPGDHDPQRPAVALDQQALLGAVLAAIRRVRAPLP